MALYSQAAITKQRGRRARDMAAKLTVIWFVVLAVPASLLPLIATSDEMTFAAAAADDGDFDKAVSHYKKAWQESIEAV